MENEAPLTPEAPETEHPAVPTVQPEDVCAPEETAEPSASKGPVPTDEAPEMPSVAAEPDITHRLAAEFIAMQAEVPGLHAPEDLAAEIFDTAAREHIPLMDAFLRYRWQEEQRVRREEERRHRAAACSPGSLREGAAQKPPEEGAFLRSFRRALR